MKLEYCHSKTYNFGDDLNLWLWPKLLGDMIDDSSDTYFLGIGTILTQKRVNERLKHAKEIVIFSSGAWGEDIPLLGRRCKVYGVRGPRTARKLGLKPELAIGDGAYLIRKVDLPVAPKKSGVGFIPHHRSEDYIDWRSICDRAGVKFISAKQPVEDFLADLQGCEKVVAEAMHGAIVADALRIPWVAAKFSPAFNEEKWYDFAESMELPLRLHELPFMSQHKMKFGKLVENSVKQCLSRIFPCPAKWGRLPVIYATAKKSNLAFLSESIKALACDAETSLSRDDKVNEIAENQFEIVKTIIRDYF